MDNFSSRNTREDIYSRAVRAGKRTYFFDVKATRNEEFYLTITESKKRFDQTSSRFFYEKHKIFLYREDFEKFSDALNQAFTAIKEVQPEVPQPNRTYQAQNKKSEDLRPDEKPEEPDAYPANKQDRDV